MHRRTYERLRLEAKQFEQIARDDVDVIAWERMFVQGG